MADIEELVQHIPTDTVKWPATKVECTGEVFLTGATGYFGSALLHQLLISKQVQHVHVLVRARSAQQAKERVVRSATIAGWWDTALAPRISYWLGDLRRPRLGLSDVQWNRLIGASEPHECIDSIVHSGARVNWYSSYDSLRAANVLSTNQLLHLAAQSPSLKTFIHVSTAPSLNFDKSDAGDEALRHALGSLNGYVRSKLVAEQVVLRAAALAGFPSHRIVLLKPGYIIGNAESGVANVDDYVWRIVAGCVSIGCYPTASENSVVYISSHDTLAAAAIDSLYAGDTKSVVKISASGLATTHFGEAVNAGLPHPLEARSASNWRGEIEERSEDLGPDHPILSVLHIVVDGDEVIGEKVSASKCKSLTARVESQSQLEAAVIRNVRYLSQIGYFSTGWTARQKDGFFGRGLVDTE